MDTPDRFEEVFAKRGGRYVPVTPLDTQLLERARREIDRQCKDKKMKATAPIVEVGFVKNTAFNACATIHDGVGYIGIYWGTYVLLFCLFNRMLAHPNILSGIGDPEKESPQPPLLSYLPTSILALDDQVGEDVLIPADDTRRDFAAILVTTAFDFILLHEFAHLANGHVALLQERDAAKLIDETEMGLDPVLRQTLEMDADCFAVGQFMKYAGSPASAAYIKGGTQEGIVFELMFAVYSMLRLFGFSENHDTVPHPSPDTRRSLIGATVATWIANVLGPDAKHLWGFAVKALDASEQAFSTLFGQDIPRAEIARSGSPAAQAWRDRIQDGWKTLFPDLERLSFRVGLAPRFHK